MVTNTRDVAVETLLGQHRRQTMTTSFSEGVIPVHTQGEVTEAEIEYARKRVHAVLRYARDPVLFANIRLTRLADRALARPAVVQVNVDLDGRLIRAQVARPTMTEAADEVHDRLRERIRRAAGDWEDIRGERPSEDPHEWRHTTAPSERPPYFPRPVEDREVIRHKAFTPSRLTVDEAAFDMGMLDYDFHVFTEEGTGQDSVLYRTGDGGYRLAQVEPRPDRVAAEVTPVTVSPIPAPTLTEEEATERLEESGMPFVFFRDERTHRGCALYHRYDGHYGLITPAG